MKIRSFSSHHLIAERWKTMETVIEFIFLGLKITVDGDCCLEIRRHLLLRKHMLLDGILKHRDTALLTKVHIVKATISPVLIYRCENLAIKKTEHWRINTFELWCWRRHWRVSWTARRSSQSILKEINPEHSKERLML